MKKCVLILMVTIVSLGWRTVLAEVPHQINYQGHLLDIDGNYLSGTYNFTFNLYLPPVYGQ